MFDDFQGHILDDYYDVSVGPVDISSLNEGEMSCTIWIMSLFSRLFVANVHMSCLLKTQFHVEDDNLSPFCTTFMEDISTIWDCYVTYMPFGTINLVKLHTSRKCNHDLQG
jgi:hypothetical protein